MATDKVAGRNPPPLLLNRVDCIGTEDNITQCPRDDTHGCLNTAAGVICPKGNNKLASIYYNNIMVLWMTFMVSHLCMLRLTGHVHLSMEAS